MNLDRFSEGKIDPASASVLYQCDHCGGEIYLGAEVKLCSDGAIVHEDCIQEYAVEQLMPTTKTIEEALGLEGGF